MVAISALLLSSSSATSQCPGARLDSVCLGSLLGSGGGICSSVLPSGMVGQHYDQDVSFVMPRTVHVTDPISLDVDLEKINITGMSGLPTGINWSCDAFSHSTCEYFPPSGEALGAIKFCGTPLVAGHYNITVYIHARVNAGTFGRQESDQTYSTSMDVVPDTSGGVGTFSFHPGTTIACDSATYSFSALYRSTTNYVRYEWDYGNGHTSNDTVSEPQHYDSAGVYKVSLRTIVYDWVITDFSIATTDGSTWSGDIEELTTISRPDFYWKILDVGYRSNTINETFTPSWSHKFVRIPAGTGSVHYQIWDEDAGPPFGSADDEVADGHIPCRYGAQAYIDWGSSGFIKFDTVRGNVFYDTILIKVFNTPVSPTLSVTKDSFCTGDSTLLYIPSYPSCSYQWYNDSVIIPLATDNIYTAHSTGNYHVLVTNNESGCAVNSNTRHIGVFNKPRTILAAYIGPGQIANTNFPGPGYTIEWYRNGVLIAGANSPVLNQAGDGIYTCRVYNTAYPACDESSAPVFVSGIEGVDNASAKIAVFPNPAKGLVNIASYLEGTRMDNISIIDMNGTVVKTYDLNSDGKFEMQLDLSDLASGVYVIHFIGPKTGIVKKVILN